MVQKLCCLHFHTQQIFQVHIVKLATHDHFHILQEVLIVADCHRFAKKGPAEINSRRIKLRKNLLLLYVNLYALLGTYVHTVGVNILLLIVSPWRI